MGKQIRLLLKISLCNLLGWNEFRFTKDAKKKTRYCLMGALWIFLIVMMIGYVSGLSYGLIYMEMGYLVPAVLSMCVAAVVFIFTMLKAGAVLFDKNVYEKQIVLPVTIRAMIISRFLSMYFTNMFLGILVMLPGMAVYGVMEKPGVSFYLYGILGSLFLPLLPLTLASVAGAVIAGISSRWKRKKLVAIVLTMILICGLLLGSFGLSGMREEQLEALLWQMASLIEEQIQRTYPPGIWLAEAMVYGRIGGLILFLAVSVGCFLIFLEILRPFYANICNLLGSYEAKGNYQMRGLKRRSVLWSMVNRELRHYFSSVVYVVNTMVGNVLMVLMAIVILVFGKEAIEEMMGMSGIVERGLPVLLGMMAALMPMSSCSISMEGRQWWMMQTLPVSEKDIMRSKVWADIVVAVPFYLVSELLVIIALRPGLFNLLFMLAVPAVYIIFAAMAGLAVNRKFPLLEWENETRVVKQSASTMVAMLVGLFSGIIPLAILLIFREISAQAVYIVLIGVLLLAVGALEMKAVRTK